ncbi:MAG: gliding motility-associated-like protein [Crocinitomix sp.]|jgi:gliding motility-associated-like protein
MDFRKLFFTVLLGLINVTAFAQPISEFIILTSDGCINDEVDCISLAYGGPEEWFWDFGDGTTIDEINPSHTYSNVGTFTITLTVTDADGLTDSYSETYTVHPPLADFSTSPSTGCATPRTVFFTDLSTLPDTWFWDFGDGATSTLQNPIHNYTSGGTFTVTLTTTDTIFGCSDDATAVVEVSLPIAEIGGPTSEFGCAPHSVDFVNSSTNLGPGTITDYLWDFGDGTTSIEETPSYVYDSPGIFTVSLTVTNDLGCSNTDEIPFYVQTIGPDVNFGADIFFAECPDLTVNFTDSTIFGAPIVSWNWGFGDGGSSTLQNPVHIFTDFGDYDISLTVSDIDGCSRTLVFEDYIIIRDTIPPVFDTCPTDQVESLSADCDFSLPDYTPLATVSDNCTDPLVITQTPVPGTVVTADQLITLQTMDEQDSITTCTFTVLLFDNINPTITCPPDQNVSFDADCAYTLLDYTGMAIATDNCLAPFITQAPSLGTVITATETITLTATDTAGNIMTCSFDVIPIDDTAPTITCPPDITVNTDLGVCGATVIYGTPIGDDNCSPTTALTAGLISGSLFSVGTTTNTYEVIDDVGLSATCSFDVTVFDNENPILTCGANITVDNDPGECGATVTYTDPTFSDNCGTTGLVQTDGLASGVAYPIGTTTNSFVITDESGNSVTCSFDVIVEDNEAPTIVCPDDIATCDATTDFEEPTFTDNCGDLVLTLNAGLPSGSEFPHGTTTNVYIVTDAFGNEATCSFVVTRNPIPAIVGGIDVTINAGDSTELDPLAPLASVFEWSPVDGLSNPFIQNPMASPMETTTYVLTVTTPEGCQNSKELTVTINLEILINNYMSPNGDGKNDTWIIKGAYILEECEIQIYDSWGNKIYESTGYESDWDGTHEGDPLPPGVYYYVIACDGDDSLTGSITLNR